MIFPTTVRHCILVGLALYLLINLLDTIRRDELELWKVHGNEDSDTDKSLLTGDEV